MTTNANSAAIYPTLRVALQSMQTADDNAHSAEQAGAVAILVAMRDPSHPIGMAFKSVKADAFLRDGSTEEAKKLTNAAKAAAEEAMSDEAAFLNANKKQVTNRVAETATILKKAKDNAAKCLRAAVALQYIGLTPEDYYNENGKRNGRKAFHIPTDVLGKFAPVDDDGKRIKGIFLEADRPIPLMNLKRMFVAGAKAYPVAFTLANVKTVAEREAGKVRKTAPSKTEQAATMAESATGVDAMLKAAAAKLIDTKDGQPVPSKMMRQHEATNADAVSLFINLGAALGAFKWNKDDLLLVDMPTLHRIEAASKEGNALDLTEH